MVGDFAGEPAGRHAVALACRVGRQIELRRAGYESFVSYPAYMQCTMYIYMLIVISSDRRGTNNTQLYYI